MTSGRNAKQQQQRVGNNYSYLRNCQNNKEQDSTQAKHHNSPNTGLNIVPTNWKYCTSEEYFNAVMKNNDWPAAPRTGSQRVHILFISGLMQAFGFARTILDSFHLPDNPLGYRMQTLLPHFLPESRTLSTELQRVLRVTSWRFNLHADVSTVAGNCYAVENTPAMIMDSDLEDLMKRSVLISRGNMHFMATNIRLPMTIIVDTIWHPLPLGTEAQDPILPRDLISPLHSFLHLEAEFDLRSTASRRMDFLMSPMHDPRQTAHSTTYSNAYITATAPLSYPNNEEPPFNRTYNHEMNTLTAPDNRYQSQPTDLSCGARCSQSLPPTYPLLHNLLTVPATTPGQEHPRPHLPPGFSVAPVPPTGTLLGPTEPDPLLDPTPPHPEPIPPTIGIPVARIEQIPLPPAASPPPIGHPADRPQHTQGTISTSAPTTAASSPVSENDDPAALSSHYTSDDEESEESLPC